MPRTILHCDLNAFFASVECLYRPELKGVPMAVSGNAESRHGIILAKNEPAKKYGIKTAETIWEAKRKCPQLILVPPSSGKYSYFSRLARDIYESFTDQVEPFGIDECWLDVTGSTHLFGSGEEIAHTIRRRIRKELGLSVSIGVADNKIFAKLGSDMKKPDAVTVIGQDNFRRKVWPLSASDLLFVGRASVRHLAKAGIHTIGDIANTQPAVLRTMFGSQGHMLYTYANGLDASPVRSAATELTAPKSIGNSNTFRRNLITEQDVKIGFASIAEKVSARLREHKLRAQGLQIWIRSSNFKGIVRQLVLPQPTLLASDLLRASMELFENERLSDLSIRALGIRCYHFYPADDFAQMDMFLNTGAILRRENLEYSIDDIRRRFGAASLLRGSIMNSDIGCSSPRKHYNPFKGDYSDPDAELRR